MTEELKLQLYLLELKYDISEINLSRIDWKRFLTDSSNNRILYYCCKRIIQLDLEINDSTKELINNVLKTGQEYIRKVKVALKFLNQNLSKYPFLICKTEKIINYVTFDIDVLFRKSDYREILSYLQNLGGKYIECKNKLQADIIYTGLVRIDTHTNFHWQKSVFISVDKLWEDIVIKKVFGIKCYTPSLNNEVTLNLLNLIYERHYIPLLDYYFLLKHINKINWDEVISVAIRYNWIDGLMIILNKFNQIHFFLNNQILIDLSKYNKNYKFNNVNMLRIPFVFTYSEGISVFFERLLKCRYLRFYEFFYFLFSKTRFHLSKRNRVPIYGHWFYLK